MQLDSKHFLNFIDSPEYSQHGAVIKKSCLKELRDRQLEEIRSNSPLLNQMLIVYDFAKEVFSLTHILLIPNILTFNNQYLVLSTCTIRKLVLQQNEQSISGVQLQNRTGSVFIFFRLKQQSYEWTKKLKIYCRLKDYSKKFRTLENIMRDFQIVQHKKSKKSYTCQIIKNPTERDYLQNEIQTLRSIKHRNLLDLKWVYEEGKQLYLIYEYFRGERLQELLNQGLFLEETQLASLVQQTLQLLKALNKHGVYHGNVNPNNLIINTEESSLKIYLIGLSNVATFNSIDKLSNHEGYLKNVSGAFIAPEILAEQVHPSIHTDLYQTGALLYYVTYYNYKKKSEFAQLDIINEKIIGDSYKLISDMGTQQKVKFKHLYSASQIDLMKRLLNKQITRISLEEALKHHWFINIKQKLKTRDGEMKQNIMELPSLKTIIELCEQSELELRLMSRKSCYSNTEDIEENNVLGEMMQDLQKRNDGMKLPSKENHERCKFFGQLKTIVERPDSDHSTKEYHNFKTIS